MATKSLTNPTLKRQRSIEDTFTAGFMPGSLIDGNAMKDKLSESYCHWCSIYFKNLQG